jgi:hypothetical protein
MPKAGLSIEICFNPCFNGFMDKDPVEAHLPEIMHGFQPLF